MFLSVDCNDWKISSLNLFRIIAPEKDKRKKANKKQKKPNMPRTTDLMNVYHQKGFTRVFKDVSVS